MHILATMTHSSLQLCVALDLMILIFFPHRFKAIWHKKILHNVYLYADYKMFMSRKFSSPTFYT